MSVCACVYNDSHSLVRALRSHLQPQTNAPSYIQKQKSSRVCGKISKSYSDASVLLQLHTKSGSGIHASSRDGKN